MLTAIKKEIFLRKEELENKKLTSVYFGGGTPSILSVEDIKGILGEVQKHFEFDSHIEITLEANPDDLHHSFLKELRETEINRLSIGTQSFFEEDLRLMNRAHTSSEAESSIKRAQDFGLENISIDLIYGSPTSNQHIWKQNLQKSIELQVPHISSYALTVEPKTALHQWVQSKKIEAPKETKQSEDFYFMVDFLHNHGFDHYEISNFGKPNFHSKHNSAYWKYEPYLGIGPSAHSYNGKNVRSWNVANNQHYLKKILNNELANEKEVLSENEQFNEMIMLGLRTANGIDLEKLAYKFNEEKLEYLYKSIDDNLRNRIFILEENHLKIAKSHWFLADGLASDLFVV